MPTTINSWQRAHFFFASLSALLLLSLPCPADEGVLLRDKPQLCIQAVQDAFLSRRWKIISQSDTAITANIHSRGRGVDATLSVSYRDNNFYYNGTATREVYSSDWVDIDDGPDKQPSKIPENWIINLQRDATLFCSKIQSRNPAAETDSPEDRLLKLQQLREKGLISEQEYQQLRQKILEDI